MENIGIRKTERTIRKIQGKIAEEIQKKKIEEIQKGAIIVISWDIFSESVDSNKAFNAIIVEKLDT